MLTKAILTTTKASNLPKAVVLITAAGSSTRMGGSCKKEFLPFQNGTVLSSSVKSFFSAASNNFEISDFIITIPRDRFESAKNALKIDSDLNNELISNIKFISGGKSRQESVFNGLKAINNISNKIVLIHDGARPFVSEKVILEVFKAAKEFGSSVPGITPTDTQKEIDENGFIIRHLVRKNLTAVQTPQGFNLEKLLEAHKICAELVENQNENPSNAPIEFTDDTEIWAHCFGKVKVVDGDINNIKITYPSDLEKLK